METKAMTLRLPVDQAEALEKVAEIDNVTVTEAIRDAIQGHIAVRAADVASASSPSPTTTATVARAASTQATARRTRNRRASTGGAGTGRRANSREPTGTRPGCATVRPAGRGS